MAQFASDAFGGTEGTELSAYSASWTRHTSYTGNMEIASGLIRQTSSTTSAYHHSGTPASADYSVSADLFMKETNGGLSSTGVIGRVDTAANTFYMARYAGDAIDGWQLYKAVGGTFTQLGSTSAQSLTDETAYNVKLEMVGTAIKLYKELSSTATISATDSAITAAGKSGIRSTGGAFSDTTGIHIDNFSADDVASGGVTGTGALTTAAITASGAGTIGHTGTGAPTITAVTASGAGTLSHTGTGAATISNVTASGSGTLAHTGTGALTTNVATLSGTGSLGAGITGTGAITIGNVTVSGTGTWTGWTLQDGANGTWVDASDAAGSWSDAAAAGGSWAVQ